MSMGSPFSSLSRTHKAKLAGKDLKNYEDILDKKSYEPEVLNYEKVKITSRILMISGNIG
jgi:hypothetical protein